MHGAAARNKTLNKPTKICSKNRGVPRTEGKNVVFDLTEENEFWFKFSYQEFRTRTQN